MTVLKTVEEAMKKCSAAGVEFKVGDWPCDRNRVLRYVDSRGDPEGICDHVGYC